MVHQFWMANSLFHCASLWNVLLRSGAAWSWLPGLWNLAKDPVDIRSRTMEIRDVAAAIVLVTSCKVCLCLNNMSVAWSWFQKDLCFARVTMDRISYIKWYQVMCSLIQMWHKWYLSGRIMNSCDSCPDFSCEIFGQEPRTCRICDFNHGRNKVGFLPVLSSGHAMTPARQPCQKVCGLCGIPKSPWLFQY